MHLLTCLLIFAQLPASPFLRQSQFELEIDKPFSAIRTSVPIREFLERVSTDRQIAILFDRRIDPSSLVNVNLNEPYLDVAVGKLSQQIAAQTVVIADTLYVAPLTTAQSVRTFAYLSQVQLTEVCKEDRHRQLELNRRKPIHWEMLATPREIVQNICESYELKIENIALLPHDLWAQGDISYPNASEALTLILIQFELSFDWINPNTIKLVELPKSPGIERSHRPKGMQIEEAMQLIQEQWPSAVVTQQGTRLKIIATLDAHEAIEELIGERKPRRQPSSLATELPMDKRRFSLKMTRLPFLALVKSLEQQGITVQYDSQQLQTAQIDLLQKISLEVTNATIDELLTPACKQLKLNHKINGLTITLEPTP